MLHHPYIVINILVLLFCTFMSSADAEGKDKLLNDIQDLYLKYELVYVQKDGKIIVLKEAKNNKAPKISEGDLNFIAFEGKSIHTGKNEFISMGVTLRIINEEVFDAPIIGKPSSIPYGKVLTLLQRLAANDLDLKTRK